MLDCELSLLFMTEIKHWRSLAPFTCNNNKGYRLFVWLYGCHCVYTIENSDSGNQKSFSECGVPFKEKIPDIILPYVQVFLVSRCYKADEPIYRQISNFLYLTTTEFCTHEGRRRN